MVSSRKGNVRAIRDKELKKIEAIIRPNKLELVKEAISEVGCSGITITEVKGFGRQLGHSEVYRGAEYEVMFQPKLKVEVVLADDRAPDAVRAIIAAAATGQVGDGKIFISTVIDAVRMRTGESGAIVVS